MLGGRDLTLPCEGHSCPSFPPPLGPYVGLGLSLAQGRLGSPGCLRGPLCLGGGLLGRPLVGLKFQKSDNLVPYQALRLSNARIFRRYLLQCER